MRSKENSSEEHSKAKCKNKMVNKRQYLEYYNVDKFESLDREK